MFFLEYLNVHGTTPYIKFKYIIAGRNMHSVDAKKNKSEK